MRLIAKMCVRCRSVRWLSDYCTGNGRHGLQSRCKHCCAEELRSKRAATRPLPPTRTEAFWSLVDKNGAVVEQVGTSCWYWTAGRHPKGYGFFRGGYAHRFAYELGHGPIPAGMEICHRCDVPRCVNPDHLFLGTHKENMQDMSRKGRVGVTAKTTVEEVVAARALRRSGATVKSIAEVHGWNHSYASGVLSGRLWSQAPGAVPVGSVHGKGCRPPKHSPEEFEE